MGIREYNCRKTGKQNFKVSVTLRSMMYPGLRIQKSRKCETRPEAERSEEDLFREAKRSLQREA
jgi:hypothetical protein